MLRIDLMKQLNLTPIQFNQLLVEAHVESKEDYTDQEIEILKQSALKSQSSKGGTRASTHNGKRNNNAKPSQSEAQPSEPASDTAPAQLLHLQKSDAELMQQATALELLNIAKLSRFQGLARQAFVQGLRPKDPQLAKLYGLAEQEVRRYQESDPYQLPFFIQPEGGEVDQITIEMIGFDSTLDLADPANTDAASLLELLFEPAKPPQALPDGRVQLKLTAAA
jgi:hypothetical protein